MNTNQAAPEIEKNEEAPSTLKKWLVAFRPFALPASTMPVIFGSVLAVTIGQATFNWQLFLLALIGMALLHTGSNLLNDVYDFKKGIDKQVNPVSGGVVRGWITAAQAKSMAALLLVIGALIGLFIVSQVGMDIFWIGLIGVTLGVFYTWGPAPLKFNALGDLAVFLNFGILGALGAWTVQTGTMSWTPVIWAVPMSLLVIAILQANNWRDIHSDSAGGIKTVASLLGDKSSEKYFIFLIMGPFLIIIALLALTRISAGLQPMPLAFLITLLAIPLALKLIEKGRNRFNSDQPLDFLALDGATAQLNLLFGLLCVAALGVDKLIA